MLRKMPKEQLIELINAMAPTINKYDWHLQKVLGFNTQNEGKEGFGKKHKGHYPFIPTGSATKVLACLMEARDYIRKERGKGWRRNLKFLDCGCGVGNIMLLASRVVGVGSVYGVEYDETTVKVARKLLGNSVYQVIHGDLVKYDGYGKYDIIYYFEPIGGMTKRDKFYNKLKRDMKVGAIIIPNGHSLVFQEDKRKRFKQLPNKYGSWWSFIKVKG